METWNNIKWLSESENIRVPFTGDSYGKATELYMLIIFAVIWNN